MSGRRTGPASHLRKTGAKLADLTAAESEAAQKYIDSLRAAADALAPLDAFTYIHEASPNGKKDEKK